MPNQFVYILYHTLKSLRWSAAHQNAPGDVHGGFSSRPVPHVRTGPGHRAPHCRPERSLSGMTMPRCKFNTQTRSSCRENGVCGSNGGGPACSRAELATRRVEDPRSLCKAELGCTRSGLVAERVKYGQWHSASSMGIWWVAAAWRTSVRATGDGSCCEQDEALTAFLHRCGWRTGVFKQTIGWMAVSKLSCSSTAGAEASVLHYATDWSVPGAVVERASDLGCRACLERAVPVANRRHCALRNWL